MLNFNVHLSFAFVFVTRRWSGGRESVGILEEDGGEDGREEEDEEGEVTVSRGVAVVEAWVREVLRRELEEDWP